MSDPMRLAASGLAVAASQVAATADNLANLRSEGYRPVEVRPVSVAAPDGAGQGVRGQAVRPAAPGDAPALAAAQEPGVDAARAFTTLMMARHAYEAGASVIETADEMSRTAVDLIG